MPESLKQELLDYWRYLVFKYQIQKPALPKTEKEVPENNFSELQNLLLNAPPLCDEDFEK